jgi:hypothetical protein
MLATRRVIAHDRAVRLLQPPFRGVSAVQSTFLTNARRRSAAFSTAWYRYLSRALPFRAAPIEAPLST